MNTTWIGQRLTVVDSTDSTLVGRSGNVIDETQKTVTIVENGQVRVFGKASIQFTLNDGTTVLSGSSLRQRPDEPQLQGGMKMREIGIDVKRPTGEWDGDENCPFYGSLRLRGQMFEGVVSGVGMQKTITIERNNVRYMKKYERFEKRTSALSAHLPSCIGDVEIGDTVRVMECRPLSKTVSFCVIEKTGGEA